MSTNVAISSSVLNESKSIPAAVNASSVGAKTVKGPSPESVVTKSARSRAATSESWTPVPAALDGMSSWAVRWSATAAGEANNMAVSSRAVSAGLAFMSRPHFREHIYRCSDLKIQ